MHLNYILLVAEVYQTVKESCMFILCVASHADA